MTTLPISSLTIDRAISCRAELDSDTIAEYAARLEDGATFPPVDVFQDGESYILADGFLRACAYRRAGLGEIPVTIHTGGRRGAMLWAAGANSAHGLRRTNAEKRAAVSRLLADAEWAKWSDREIGRRCAVSDVFVGNLRGELTANGSQSPERTYTTRHGTTATMNTGNIGRTAAPASSPAPTFPRLVELSAEVEPAPATPRPRIIPQSGAVIDWTELERMPRAWSRRLFVDVEPMAGGFALVLRGDDRAVIGRSNVPDAAPLAWNEPDGSPLAFAVALGERGALEFIAGELSRVFAEAGGLDRFAGLSSTAAQIALAWLDRVPGFRADAAQTRSCRPFRDTRATVAV
jgi:hypothetical protein